MLELANRLLAMSIMKSKIAINCNTNESHGACILASQKWDSLEVNADYGRQHEDSFGLTQGY